MDYYKNYLKGRYLTDKDCLRLLKIHEMSEKGIPFTDLKDIIYDLSAEDVKTIKKNKSNGGMTLNKGTLTDLQTIGVAYMYFAKRVLIGDSVGFGKTPQSAGLINYLKQNNNSSHPIRFIYFTKKTLAEKDQNELIRFTGDYVGLLKGETASLKKELSKIDGENIPNSYVAVHSVIKNPNFLDWFLLYKKEYGRVPFDVVIIDEASSVATAKTSDFTKPSQIICKYTNRVILLNATPFESRLESFRVQLNLVDPTLLPNKSTFQSMFQKMRDNGRYLEYIDEYKNEDVFKEMIKLRFLARRRKETGGKMEDCEARLIVVPKSSAQKRIEKLTSIPQMVYDCPNSIDRDIPMNTITCPKLQKILDILATEAKNEKTIMIYCRYKESQQGIMDVLEENGYTCRKLNGDTKAEERLQITNDFQKGRFRVLVTNVQEGLNFGNCNFTIFYSALPNPNKMVQVEGRMTREFNIKNKRVFLLATEGRELNNIKNVIANRAKSSEQFAGSDYSMILDLLREQQAV